MSSSMTIVILAAVITVSLFAFGQWLNADLEREPINRSSCASNGTC